MGPLHDKKKMRVLVLLLAVTPAANAAFQLSSTYLREVEKKHARVAMLAFPALVGLAATGHDPATGWLAAQPFDTQANLICLAAVFEGGITLPRFGDDLELREDIVPGQFFGLSGSPAADCVEDMVGRAAMGATAGWMITDVLRATL